MSPWSYVLAGAILGLAGVAQSAVGFGYALFATPLLVWIGLPLEQTIALVATCSLIQAGLGARHLRADTPWRLSFIATAVRMAGVGIGTLGLLRLTTLDPARIRLAVGALLCLLVAVQFCWRPKPVDRSHWGWAALAFSISGLLSGISGMGGPPLVLWAMAHNWSSHRTRGFLFAVFLTAIPLQLVLLTFTFDTARILRAILIALAYSPLVWFGTRIGLRLGHRISKEKLRIVAYLFLLAIGLSAVVPALLR